MIKKNSKHFLKLELKEFPNQFWRRLKNFNTCLRFDLEFSSPNDWSLWPVDRVLSLNVWWLLFCYDSVFARTWNKQVKISTSGNEGDLFKAKGSGQIKVFIHIRFVLIHYVCTFYIGILDNDKSDLESGHRERIF